jgi:ubiquinone/menaquinone biosynthesis C-methylase UbiE
MPENWAVIHDSEMSWREKLVGEISRAFIIPRYVEFFYSKFSSLKNNTFFEIGSGMGDMSKAIIAANLGQISRYVVSEQFPEGVEWLRRQGLEAIQANAQNLPWPDESFDVTVEFDVMHHVESPNLMAKELMRVGKGRCLLVESNGLSIFRKIKELMPHYRAAGERSYTPWQYKKFFASNEEFEVTVFEIFPFLFPFHVPKYLLGLLINFNRMIEKIPVLRWLCSSVAIYVEYKRKEK